MALTITLDGVDITASLNAQHPLPANPASGIFPDKSKDKYWDLLAVVAQHPALKTNFLRGGVHTMRVTDSAGASYSVKLLVNSKFSARSR